MKFNLCFASTESNNIQFYNGNVLISVIDFSSRRICQSFANKLSSIIIMWNESFFRLNTIKVRFLHSFVALYLYIFIQQIQRSLPNIYVFFLLYFLPVQTKLIFTSADKNRILLIFRYFLFFCYFRLPRKKKKK